MRPRRQSISIVNLSRRGIPKSFQDFTIEDYLDYGSEDLEKVKTHIRNYIDNIHDRYNDNIGLFLYGSNGVGKSMLASIIIKEAYINRYTSKRVTFSDYIAEYTRVWNARNLDEREELEGTFYNDFKAVEFLALEEVGKELDTKLTATVLEDCLRYREERGLPTIICTNITPKALVEKYGNSIASLIKGNFIPINIVGSDKRNHFFDEKRFE